MIAKVKNYRVAFLIILFLATLHFWSKDLHNPYQKPITGDAEAYYAYLPALFIYGNLDYTFTKEIESKHYVQGRSKSFIKIVDGEKVNKTFPGVALLYLPFFLIAHALALLFSLDADGYSFIYQLMFDIGYWFYFLLGIIFALKVLDKLKVDKKIANWSVAIVVLGTNMVFYSLYDLSVTHIHNFFLITAALFCLLRFKEGLDYKNVLISLLLICIAGITRPTNILALLMILVFIHDISFYKGLWEQFKKPLNIFKTIIICSAVFLIPLLLWKAQTGHWIVYSYGEEGFNFASPHFRKFIFSYTKGWLTYSPIVFIILIPALIVLFRSNRKQFYLSFVFYVLAIYIFSSWWCWYYGAGMGQRVMIDFSILLIFQLAITLKEIWNKAWLRTSFMTLSILLIGLNFAQAYQIKNGIITFGAATQAEFWDTFLSFEKKARVYPFDHWELKGTHQILTKEKRFVWAGSVDDTNEFPEIEISPKGNYSAIIGLENFKTEPGSKIIFSFEAKALTPIESTRLVIKLDTDHASNEHTFYLSQYEKVNEWVLMEFMIETQEIIEGPLKAFFWSAKSEDVMKFRNIRLLHYYSDEYY